jgi:hypothetical protein
VSGDDQGHAGEVRPTLANTNPVEAARVTARIRDQIARDEPVSVSGDEQGHAGECACGHPARSHDEDGCWVWRLYPEVLHPRRCGCETLRPAEVSS